MASSSGSRRYDVFPSFSGEDVRRSFLSHLLEKLHRKLIHTFIDDGIERSRPIAPELISAIRESRISIVIFSKNYASSTWCLNELVEIHNCYKDLGQMVIPVFYEIDPSHVSEQTGEFGEAFTKTCEEKTDDQKQKWIKALAEVASIAGEDSGRCINEAKMIEDISNDVSNKLFTTTDDFGDFVGIDAHIEAMNSMLCLESKEVRMVGIVGTSGIGKSTIARTLFCRLSGGFDHRAFVSYKRTIQDKKIADPGIKLSWVKQFLSDILGQKDIEINHLGAVKQRLERKKVLIVLDDVDEIELLETLVGETGWFGTESRIIVVTQDRALLKSHDIKPSLIYEVPFPSREVALQMFCKFAFKQKSPDDYMRRLAIEVAELAGNLPLCLHVLGSLLRLKDKEEWEEMMPMLQKSLNGKIEKTLKVCYDALDTKDDQELFLWIACVYNGNSVNYIKNLLEAGVLTSVKTRLRMLADKSLIRITAPNETVQMHMLLQKLGREIGKGRFLVDTNDISDVIMDNTGTNKVLAICCNTSEITEPLSMDNETFKRMTNLRFLKFFKYRRQETCEIKLNLPQGLVYLPRKLALLHWDRYPAKYLPSNFKAEHLVELEMEASKLEKLWEGSPALPSLKTMNVAWSSDLKEIPDLSKATNLEKLSLYMCTSLVTLPSSIRNLKKLRVLQMDYCTKLEVLPADVNLESLTDLSLSRCSRLSSFPQITKCISILYLEDTAIDDEESSLWIENISRLEAIRWSNCLLRCLPSNFCTKHLRSLHMPDSKFEKLWEGVQSLGNLEHMNLESCVNLKEIPDLSMATNLKQLDIAGCTSLVMLSTHSIQNLHKLKTLDMEGCTKLEDLPTDVNLESLEILTLERCSRLRSFPQISTRIEKLDLAGTSIGEVPSWIENMSKLEELYMNDCTKLEDLPIDVNLVSLTVLNLNGCSRFRSFPHISTSIERLCLKGTAIEEVPSWIENMSKLEELYMNDCTKLEDLPTDINLQYLTDLNLNGCSRLRSFPQISTRIERLDLDGTAIREVPSWIEFMSKLKGLYMNDCERLKNISPSIFKLRHLQTADFSDCTGLTSFSDASVVAHITGDHLVEDHVSRMLSKYLKKDRPFGKINAKPLDLRLRNCFNLDRDAQELILQSCISMPMVLPGLMAPNLELSLGWGEASAQVSSSNFHGDGACEKRPKTEHNQQKRMRMTFEELMSSETLSLKRTHH